MADPRHKRAYPKGPRREMTQAWKHAVRAALKNNKQSNRRPSDQRQLADAIGVHKTAITKMFEARTSALVDPICEVLALAQPMVALDPDGEISQVVAALEPIQQKTLLEFAQFLLAQRPRKS